MNLLLKAKIVEKYRTQADFATLLKTRESTVSRIVTGRRQLPVDEQRRWAAVLNCKPEDIFRTV